MRIDDYTRDQAIEQLRAAVDATGLPASHYRYAYNPGGGFLLVGSVCNPHTRRSHFPIESEIRDVVAGIVSQLADKCGCFDNASAVVALRERRKQARRERRAARRAATDTRQTPHQRETSLRDLERSNGLRSGSPIQRARIIARDGYICGLCGGEVAPDDVEIDHIVPVSGGGDSNDLNLQVSHSRCNQKKGSSDWLKVHDRGSL